MTWLTNPYRFGGIQEIGATASVNWGVQTFYGLDTPIINDLEFASVAAGADICAGGQGYERYSSAAPTSTFVTNNAIFDAGIGGGNATGAPGDYMQVVYTFASAVLPVEARITASGVGDSGPLGFAIIVSYDGRATWTPAAIINTGSYWSANQQKTFTFTPTLWIGGSGRSAARAWRCSMTAGPGSWPVIAEMVFAATAGGATLCTGGTVICPLPRGGVDAANAFDGDNGTDFQGQGWATPDQRLGYVFSGLVNPVEFRMRSSAGSPFGNPPTSFTLEWSTDLLNWTTALTVSGITWAGSETKTWAIP
jgi:hypothetical protein